MINIQIRSDIIRMQIHKEEKEDHLNWREVKITEKRVAVSLSLKSRNDINMKQIKDEIYLKENHIIY
jgi:hypothetical protein